MIYEDVVKRLEKNNIRLADKVTEEYWLKHYSNCQQKLPLICTNVMCKKEKSEILTTSILSALSGNLGCGCRLPGYFANLWIDKIEKLLEARYAGIEVKREHTICRIKESDGTFFVCVLSFISRKTQSYHSYDRTQQNRYRESAEVGTTFRRGVLLRRETFVPRGVRWVSAFSSRVLGEYDGYCRC